jgi:peptidyl-prolyl cis-trans isomerase D
MLDLLRRKAGSWALRILLLLIAVTFIGWGIGTYSEREEIVVATVGEARITRAQVDEAAAGLERAYRDVYGASLPPEMARVLDFRSQALNTLLQQEILLQEARTMRLVATDAEVQREIAAMSAFQADGRFREDLYQVILARSRMTPAEFENAKRREITLRKMESLFSAGVHVTEAEARDFFDLIAREVRLLVVTADPGESVPPPAVTENEIAARYEEDRESYRIPAHVKLRVVRFDPTAFEQQVELSEEEIVAFYEGNADRFRTEEERLVSHVLIPGKGKDKEPALETVAAFLSEAAMNKDAFDNAARTYGKGKPSETWLKRRDARPEAADAIFSAPVDSLVGPIEVPDGLLVLRVNRIRFPEPLPLPQVRDRVAALLRHEKGKDLAIIRAYEAHGKAVESRDLAAASAPYGIVPAETGWLSGEGGGTVPLPVVQEALVLQEGEIGPVKTAGDVHYLFQVTGREETRIPPLEEVRDKVKATVVREKQRETARAVLRQVLAESGTAGEVRRNAARAGLAAKTTALFAPLSGEMPDPLALAGDIDIREDITALSPETPVLQKVFEAGDRFLGIAFIEERPASDRDWAEARDAVMAELAEQKRTRILEAFLADRMKQAGVTVDQDALR